MTTLTRFIMRPDWICRNNLCSSVSEFTTALRYLCRNFSSDKVKTIADNKSTLTFISERELLKSN